MPRKNCSYRTLTRSSVVSSASSSSSMTSAFSGSCCADLDATYREDSSFCYSVVVRALPVSVLYFLLLVGVLVVIHELGHFAAAKLLDVKVLRFSIGYGRPLFRVKRGEPGPPSDVPRRFGSRPLWQRLMIVFAGPAANLVLPVVIYFVFFAGHSVLPAAVIGDVLDGGAASRAGLEPGDRVLEIDGKPVRYWEEIETAGRSPPGKEPPLRVSRSGKVFERYLAPLEEAGRHRDGSVTLQGWVGITHAPFAPLVGVIDGEAPAARARLATGDLIISIDGLPGRNWSDVQHHLGKFARRASLVYFRGTEVPGVPQIRLLAAGFADLVPETQTDAQLNRQTYTGLERAEMFVAHVDGGSPADSAGLRRGDLVTALDGVPVAHWS